MVAVGVVVPVVVDVVLAVFHALPVHPAAQQLRVPRMAHPRMELEAVAVGNPIRCAQA